MYIKIFIYSFYQECFDRKWVKFENDQSFSDMLNMRFDNIDAETIFSVLVSVSHREITTEIQWDRHTDRQTDWQTDTDISFYVH